MELQADCTLTQDWNRRCDEVHALSCYVPTFAACRDEEDAVCDYLQQALSEIPVNQPFYELSDFNTWVGSGVGGDE